MVKQGDNYHRTGNAAAVSAFLNGSISPSYANLTGIPTRSNWSGVHRNFVAEQLSWKNYGNGHTIFDASQGTSPDGGAVDNSNAQIAWSPSYPTLMGWNGANTYGVRVDAARTADNANNSNTVGGLSAGSFMQYQGFTLDANTMTPNRSGFTYSVNAPFTGPIVHFDAPNYGLQLNSQYFSSGIGYRTRNGDNGTWNPWREFITTANIGNYADNLGNHSATTTLNLNNNLLGTVGRIEFNGIGGNSGQGGHAYAIFQEGGDWTHPYPDLRIAYHTGIKLGANAGYQGIRFYNDYDMSGLVMAVNDATTGGANNVYIPNTLGVGTTVLPYRLTVGADILASGGWVRVAGGQGLYFENQGGGWNMSDATWIRGYGSKPILNQQGSCSPTIRADQSSSCWFAGEFNSYDAWTGPGIITYGYMQAYDYYYNSSREYKKDIAKFEPTDYTSALSFMDNLNLNYYRYKKEGDYHKTHVGFIAEETPTNLTSPGKNAVSYGMLSVYNTGAIKALKEKVEKLENESTTPKTISDFGAETSASNKVFVKFSDEFKNTQKTALPIITATAFTAGTQLSISEINAEGFSVEIVATTSPVTFNWIAMARSSKEAKSKPVVMGEKFKSMLQSAENDTRPIPVKSYKDPIPTVEDPTAPFAGYETSYYHRNLPKPGEASPKKEAFLPEDIKAALAAEKAKAANPGQKSEPTLKPSNSPTPSSLTPTAPKK